jgi:hypothetical protein
MTYAPQPRVNFPEVGRFFAVGRVQEPVRLIELEIRLGLPIR